MTIKSKTNSILQWVKTNQNILIIVFAIVAYLGFIGKIPAFAVVDSQSILGNFAGPSIAIGGVLFVIGFFLTSTGIGATVGIPLGIAGIALALGGGISATVYIIDFITTTFGMILTGFLVVTFIIWKSR